MERHEILDMMGALKLAGMRHAYDEVIADALKRQHSAQNQPRSAMGSPQPANSQSRIAVSPAASTM